MNHLTKAELKQRIQRKAKKTNWIQSDQLTATERYFIGQSLYWAMGHIRKDTFIQALKALNKLD